MWIVKPLKELIKSLHNDNDKVMRSTTYLPRHATPRLPRHATPATPLQTDRYRSDTVQTPYRRRTTPCTVNRAPLPTSKHYLPRPLGGVAGNN